MTVPGNRMMVMMVMAMLLEWKIRIRRMKDA
jgi:hypothetical protein